MYVFVPGGLLEGIDFTTGCVCHDVSANGCRNMGGEFAFWLEITE